MTAEEVVEVSDIIDDVKDLVEDTVELVEVKASWMARNPKVVVCIATLAGAATGAVLTYLAVSRRLETKYQKFADEQIEDVKARYSVLRKESATLEELAGKYPDDEETAKEKTVSEKIINQQGYKSYDRAQSAAEVVEAEGDEEVTVTQAIVEATMVTRNPFESDDPDRYFDMREETQRRNQHPDKPFVITQEEFNLNETDYDQISLTYYDGDDVLCDQKDEPITDIEKVMGYENLLRFGHGSGDPSVVYIRNNRLRVDFEVSRSEGKFAKEVLGFDDELKHSDRRPRKFRPNDE